MSQCLVRHWCTQTWKMRVGAGSWRDYFLEEQLQAISSLVRESHEAMINWVAQKQGSYKVILGASSRFWIKVTFFFFNIAAKLHVEEKERDDNDTSGLQSFFTRAEAVISEILHREGSFGAML